MIEYLIEIRQGACQCAHGLLLVWVATRTASGPRLWVRPHNQTGRKAKRARLTTIASKSGSRPSSPSSGRRRVSKLETTAVAKPVATHNGENCQPLYKHAILAFPIAKMFQKPAKCWA